MSWEGFYFINSTENFLVNYLSSSNRPNQTVVTICSHVPPRGQIVHPCAPNITGKRNWTEEKLWGITMFHCCPASSCSQHYRKCAARCQLWPRLDNHKLTNGCVFSILWSLAAYPSNPILCLTEGHTTMSSSGTSTWHLQLMISQSCYSHCLSYCSCACYYPIFWNFFSHGWLVQGIRILKNTH